MEIPIEINEHDTVEIDGTVYTIAAIHRGDAEIQMSTGGLIDTIMSPSEFESKINDADRVQFIR